DVGLADHPQAHRAQAGPAGASERHGEREDRTQPQPAGDLRPPVELEEHGGDDQEEGSEGGEDEDAVLAQELAERRAGRRRRGRRPRPGRGSPGAGRGPTAATAGRKSRPYHAPAPSLVLAPGADVALVRATFEPTRHLGGKGGGMWRTLTRTSVIGILAAVLV